MCVVHVCVYVCVVHVCVCVCVNVHVCKCVNVCVVATEYLSPFAHNL